MTDSGHATGDAAGAPEPADVQNPSSSDIDLLLGGFMGVEEDAEQPEATPPVTGSAPEGVPRVAAPAPSLDRGSSPYGPGTRGSGAGYPVASGPKPKFVWTMPQPGPWMLWWIPVLCVPLLGGIAAWFVMRRTHETAARFMLGVGIGLGMLGSLLFLRYADVIAGYTAGAKDTVIQVPGKSAPTKPAQ